MAMMSLENSKVVRNAGLATVIIVVVIGGVIGWRWFVVPPAVPPHQSAAPSQTAIVKAWTINGQPVGDGLTLKPGEKLEIFVDLQPATDGPKGLRPRWSPQGPWIAGKDHLDAWVRFAQETPWSDPEAVKNVHELTKRRPKQMNDPHFGRGSAPLRAGEYELQVVVHKRKTGGFGADRPTGGEVVAASRVRVTPVESE